MVGIFEPFHLQGFDLKTFCFLLKSTYSNVVIVKKTIIKKKPWRCELKSAYDANNSPFLHHNFSFELKMERFIAFFAKIERCFTTKSTSYIVFLWQSHHLSHQAWYLILLYKSVWTEGNVLEPLCVKLMRTI